VEVRAIIQLEQDVLARWDRPWRFLRPNERGRVLGKHREGFFFCDGASRSGGMVSPASASFKPRGQCVFTSGPFGHG